MSADHDGGRVPDPMRRALLAALVGGGTALAAGGCVDLVDTGPVIAVGPGSGGNNVGVVTVYPRGPAAGALPKAIVLGFLDSCGVAGPDYSTAASYLTAAAKHRWHPESAVTVVDGTHLSLTAAVARAVVGRSAPSPATSGAGRRPAVPSPSPPPPAQPLLHGATLPSVRPTRTPVERTTVVTLNAPAVGALDRRGSWSNSDRPNFALDLHLRTVNGQWRIDTPPAGLIVTADGFGQVWQPYRLYFPSPSGDVLVPDPVYLPGRGPAVEQLVQALIAGPSPWLAPVVRQVLPSTATLGAAGVQLAGGLATVDLEGVPTLSSEARRQLAAQLVWTLEQVSVTDVSIITDGLPLSIDGAPAPQAVTSATWTRLSPDVLSASKVNDLAVLRSGPRQSGTILLRGGQGALQPVPLPTTIARGPRPAWVATEAAGSRLIFVDEKQGRLTEVASGSVDALVAPLAEGTGMLRPQIDHGGLVWVLDFPGPMSRLRVIDTAGSAQIATVDTTAVPGASVRRVVLSRDGQRAAVVLRSGAGQVLALSRVERDGPPRLERSRSVLGPVGQIIDVAWTDAITLLVLQRGADGSVSVVQVDSDGSNPVTLGRPSRDSISLTAGPDTRPALVGTASGQLLAQGETPRWTKVDTGYAPVFPG